VITQPANELRGKTTPNMVETWSKEHKLDVFTPVKLSNEIDFLKSQRLDLGIVASFGQILSVETLKTPSFGWINWHPSKLPALRGPTPMQSFLASGSSETALSWIEMGQKMDAGGILLQIDQDVDIKTDIAALAVQMGNLGASTWAIAACLQLYQQTYPQYQFSIDQEETKVTLCKMLHKEDRSVDISNLCAFEVYNHFRAYRNFPGTVFQSKYFKQEAKIVEVDFDYLDKQSLEYKLPIEELLQNSGILESKTVFNEFFKQKNQVFLICKDQTLLPIKSIQLLENNQKVVLGGFNFKA
jgi:methionyl-tRNA formyltransferase